MFLDVEWPRVQGKRVAEHRNAIFWENPLQEFAERESYELDEKDIDKDKGNFDGKVNT
jgi:hypothetical protein